MSQTAAEYLKERYLKTERPLRQQITDAERERDRIRGELHVERVEHIKTRNERDMLARKLADLSTKHTDARIVLTMALTALKPYEEHVEARRVRKRIREIFNLPPEVDA